jgi:response regulator RpfG family c-di-GMP phosphodiesterase
MELHEKLSILHPKLKTINVYAGRMSETINKKRVYICLKDETGAYYDKNMLTYVLCHEYAHVLCDEIQPHNPHTEKFFLIFKTLLNDAASRGLYNPNIPPLKKYCGVTG